jgi:DNA-directed RNA polymerase subunit RPC12/RpoP
MFYFSSGRYIINYMGDDATKSDDKLAPKEGEPEPEFPCPKCGTRILVGQRFCSNCGRRFAYRCRHCGAPVETLSGFCTNCGGKLYLQKQPAKPSAEKVSKTPKEKTPKVGKTTPRYADQVGRYLILLAIIVFVGAILYTISTSQQGDISSWFSGSFIFGGKSPASTPPTTDTQQNPEPGPDLPSYTTEQVIDIAKKASPHCRLSTRRTG